MRRRANRLPLELAVSFRELPFAGLWQTGRTVNISKTGVMFHTAAPTKVPVGTPLEFVLLLSGNGGAVDDSSETGVAHCTGRIVREASSTGNALVASIDEYQLTRLPSSSSPFVQKAAFAQNERANADESTRLDAEIPDLDLAGRLDVPVLITAVAGSDREEAARLLHRRGIRRMSPFVHFNCGSRPSDEHNVWRRLLSQASGGTLFLDDVGAMSVSLQRSLLDVLCSETSDVRIIAGAGAQLQRQLEAGTFQRDLFYRINVIHLECRTKHVLAEEALVAC